jgi:hypothetical protein
MMAAGLAVQLLASCAPAAAVTGTTPDSLCPPATNFLDVGVAPGPGGAYARPTLSVSCGGGKLVVLSNGMPTYTFVSMTPNPLTAQNLRWEITLTPVRAAAVTAIPLLGSVGFAVNGLPIFGPNEAAQPAQQAWGDPIYNGITDGCRGHTAFMYHYHALVQKCLVPSGLVATPWTNADPSAGAASPVLGYALDGFAIYGRYECADTTCAQVREMKSAYDLTGNPTTNAWSAYTFSAAHASAEYLDRCNGHVGPRGDYHYHETAGFPYVIGCYAGTPAADGMDMRMHRMR